MSQLSNQSDLLTDTYSMTPSTSSTPQSDANTSQKKVLGIAAATMLLGGAAWAVSHKIKEQGKEHGTSSVESGTANTASTVVLPDDVDVAGKVTDGMSFEQAFTEARQEVGMGGVFSWHGHWYNTFEKEEW